jgi:hypothetical protein
MNALTRAPIGGALVFTPDNRFAKLTDNDGHFDYPISKPSGDSAAPGLAESQGRRPFSFCCIMARKPGFLTDPDAEGGQISSGSDSVIALIPEGLIKGRVSLPSSEAASGVIVQIYSRQVQDGTLRWVRGATVSTRSNGEFRFSELVPGEYKIVTQELMDRDPSTMGRGRQLYGFPPVYFPGAVDFTSASPIQIKAGQTVEADISPVRQPYYPVHIPLADAADHGMVTVSIQGHDSPGYSLGYRSDSHAIEGFLPNGSYLVKIDSFEPNPASGSVILTVSGGPAQGATMVLSRHSSIQLNVTENFNSKDENRSGAWSVGTRTFDLHGPRLNLSASLEPLDGLDLRGARSVRPPTGPDDDSMVIEDVAPGRYRLRLFSSRGYVASATAGGVDLLQQPLVVSSGSNLTVDIHMRDDFANVEGSSTNMSAAENASENPIHSGRGLAPAYIYFVPQPGTTGQFLQTAADNEGKFESPNLAPGKYLVLVFQKEQRNLPYRDVEAMRAYELKGRTVQLAPGQKERLELQIISSPE